MSKQQKEIWKWIPGYNKYQASNRGKIKSFRIDPAGIVLRGDPTRFGHIRVSITLSGKSQSTLVHRLVLMTFCGPPEGDQLCRHLNGIPYDNRVENLKWGDAKSNAADRTKHGLEKRRVLIKEENLTDAEVATIRTTIHEPDRSIADVALEFDVHPRTVRHVVRGDIAAFDSDTAHDIICQYIDGADQPQLAKKYGVAAATISYVLNRKGAYANLKGPTVERKHRKGGPKDITHEEAVAIREAYAADRANTVTSLGAEYNVSPGTICLITTAQQKWSYFGNSVENPPVVALEVAQKIHDEYHSNAANVMDIVAKYSTSFYTVKDIAARTGEYSKLKPPATGKRKPIYIEHDEAEEIRQQYMDPTEKHTLASLAQLHRSSIGTINAVVLATGRYKYFGTRLGKTACAKPRSFSLEVAQEILDLYSSKQYDQQDLATKFRCSKGTIKKILQRDGCYSALESPKCLTK